MNKLVILNVCTEFEAEIVAELLKANGIEAEISENNDEYSLSVFEIDKAKAEILINNYNNAEDKKELKKTEDLKTSIIKMAVFIALGVAFYYLMSLLFKFTLKLF